MNLKTEIIENYRAIKKYHALIRFMALKDLKVNVVDTVLSDSSWAWRRECYPLASGGAVTAIKNGTKRLNNGGGAPGGGD